MDASGTDRGGEDDLRVCLAELLQLPDESIQFIRRRKGDFQEHREFTGHTVAFQHIRDAVHERIKNRLLLGVDLQIDESFDVVTQRLKVHVSAVISDDAVPLQLHGLALRKKE